MLYGHKAEALRTRSRERRVCLGIHHSALSPQLVEMYGHLGLDFVIVSAEVESLDRGVMENLLRAADAGGSVPIVKIARNDPALIGEAMNAGAPAVMVPHVTTRAQLDEAVRGSQFQPRGTRGLCPVSRNVAFGALALRSAVRAVSDGGCVIPIIEDREALPNLEEIFACPAVEIVELGPFDMSQSLGLDPDRGYANPEIVEIVQRMGALARKYHKALLAPLWLPDGNLTPDEVLNHQIDQLIARNVTMFYGIEVHIVGRALRSWMRLRDVGAN